MVSLNFPACLLDLEDKIFYRDILSHTAMSMLEVTNLIGKRILTTMPIFGCFQKTTDLSVVFLFWTKHWALKQGFYNLLQDAHQYYFWRRTAVAKYMLIGHLLLFVWPGFAVWFCPYILNTFCIMCSSHNIQLNLKP